jgi:virulence factor Mce-like protein
MRTWRLVANLAVFTVVALALIAYGIVDLLGDPFASATRIAAVFPNAAGLYQNFSVELNGVTVGTVSAVHLVARGAEVDMTIDPGVSVPRDVVASIDVANDLGQQVVELTPRDGGRTPALQSGDVVPVVRGDVPVEVGKVVAAATRLLRAIPPGRLNQLLGELAQGLQGQGADIRTIVAASTAFSQQFLRYQHQFDALLKNAPPVMDAVSAGGHQLSRALADTRAIVEVLARDETSVQGDLTHGEAALGALGGLTTNQAPDFACLIHDFSQLNANLADPANLQNLSTSLTLNRDFFGAVTAVAVAGTAKPLAAGQAANPDQTFLRTRMLLPPGSPMGETYASPVGVPAVRPGAGCTTELGHGVGPASQAGFVPAAGGQVSRPSAAESVVRGRGSPQGPTGPSAASEPSADDALAGPPPVADLLVVAVAAMGLAFAWGVRPARRRRRT